MWSQKLNRGTERSPKLSIHGASPAQESSIVNGISQALRQQLRFFETVPDSFTVIVCHTERKWESVVDKHHGSALAINRGSTLILRSSESPEMTSRFPELLISDIGSFAGHELSHSCWALLPNGSRWTPYWLCEGVATCFNRLAHYPTIAEASKLWASRIRTDDRLLAFDYRVGILEDVALRSASYALWGHLVSELLVEIDDSPQTFVRRLSDCKSAQAVDEYLMEKTGRNLRTMVKGLLKE